MTQSRSDIWYPLNKHFIQWLGEPVELGPVTMLDAFFFLHFKTALLKTIHLELSKTFPGPERQPDINR